MALTAEENEVVAHIVAVVPKELHALLEFKVSDLRKLHKAMDMCTVNMDPQKSEEFAANEYFCKFYKFIDELLSGLEKNDGG